MCYLIEELFQLLILNAWCEPFKDRALIKQSLGLPPHFVSQG